MGLGVTQIVGYGTLMYAYAILLPRMAEDFGMTLSAIFGILSMGLFLGGLASPLAGSLVDRFGGKWVMTAGSAVAGLALIALSLAKDGYSLFFLILFAEAAGMFVLYNVAFASITRLDSPIAPARSISIITLFGGVASTIFWPLTLWLYNILGWEKTWVVLGIALIVVCVPIHYLALSGAERVEQEKELREQHNWPQLQGEARKHGLVWMVTSFMFSAFVMGAVMALWVTNVEDIGHSAAMAALAGAVIGPFKTVGRFFEMLVSRNLYPLFTHALSLGLLLAAFLVVLTVGFTVPGVILAAALYGMGDGIQTIAGGTLPLALFGREGYGARLGWISSLKNGISASAPFVFAWITQHFGGWTSFAVMLFFLALAFVGYCFIPDPRKPERAYA